MNYWKMIISFYKIPFPHSNYMKTTTSIHREHPKIKVSLKDAFTKENILRALRESTEDQRKVLTGKSKRG